MDLYTLNKQFEKLEVIDNYESLIWTERYYGDSNAELVFPATLAVEVAQKIPLNSFLSIDESNEPMIVETLYIEDKKFKVQGISVLSWLNNRFIRTSAKHQDRTWILQDLTPGEILWVLLRAMCCSDSSYLNGTIDIGLPTEYLVRLIIPELGLHSYDILGDRISIDVPFGPLYDEMKKIATAYRIGMQILLERNINPDAEKPLGFRNYRGVDHTHEQDPDAPQNQIVQFSAALNSLDNVKELHSQSIHKNLAFTFAPSLTGTTPEGPPTGDFFDPSDPVFGVAVESGTEEYSSFDLRAKLVFVEDLVTDTRLADDIGTEPDLNNGDYGLLFQILNAKAKNELNNSQIINVVDGDVVETGMFQYGRDYSLGDTVEMQGRDGSLSSVMVTEHVIAQDSSGDRKYGIFSHKSDEVSN